MKTTNLKYIAIALSALMLMQSCVAYHKAPVSVDEAVATNRVVKIYSKDNVKYKFKKLVKEDDKIYGISTLNGINQKLFAPYVREIDQDNEQVKILLPFDIKEIYTKNRTMSTVFTIIVVLSPVWIALALYAAVAISY